MMDLSLIAKATVIFVMGLLVTSAIHRARASVRALILAAAFASVLLIPIARFALPSVSVVVPMPRATPHMLRPSTQTILAAPDVVRAQGPSRPAPSSSWSALSMSSVLQTGWIAGMIAFLLPLISTMLRLRAVRRNGVRLREPSRAAHALAAEAGIRREIAVFGSEDIGVPVTYGLFRPIIVMPLDAERWTSEETWHALLHEIEHVRRGDWAVHLLARAVCAIYWFHPLAWVAWRRLRLDCERACDDAVVRTADETAYANQLVTLARLLSARPVSVLSMVNRSDLSARVAAVLDLNQRRGRVGATGAAITVSAAAVLLLAIAPLQAVGQVANTPQPASRDQLVRERQGRATISGYVYDPLGSAIEHLQVILENSPNIGFGYADVARTDATGHFTFVKVPAGSFFLSAALDYFPPTTVTIDDEENVQQDVKMALAPFMLHFVVCDGCAVPQIDPFVMPESLRKEFEADREVAWRSPVVGPAPVDGWEFDQPQALPYPDGPKRAGIAGTVFVEGRIGTDGFATGLRVLSGHPDLATPAIALLKEQRWEPARIRGIAVGVPMQAEIEYILKPGT